MDGIFHHIISLTSFAKMPRLRQLYGRLRHLLVQFFLAKFWLGLYNHSHRLSEWLIEELPCRVIAELRWPFLRWLLSYRAIFIFIFRLVRTVAEVLRYHRIFILRLFLFGVFVLFHRLFLFLVMFLYFLEFLPFFFFSFLLFHLFFHRNFVFLERSLGLFLDNRQCDNSV